MNPVHNLSEQAKHWLDVAAISGAVVAGVSLAQTALVFSIIAAAVSIVLGAIRLHDRLKYGRGSQ